jgi:prophage antirepressor-like protein
METKQALVIFEGVEIRRVEKDGQQWISALDVAKALEYSNPTVAVKNTVFRNKERFEGYSIWLPLQTKGGVQNTTMLNLKGVIAFCMLSKQKQAVPFQKWADSVLEKEILNIPDDIRLKAKRKRLEFTDTLKEHGYTKPHEYIQTTVQMKENLGIDKTKKKPECDLIEVMKIATAEMLAKTNLMISEKNGYHEVNPVCIESAKIIDSATKKII